MAPPFLQSRKLLVEVVRVHDTISLQCLNNRTEHSEGHIGASTLCQDWWASDVQRVILKNRSYMMFWKVDTDIGSSRSTICCSSIFIRQSRQQTTYLARASA